MTEKKEYIEMLNRAHEIIPDGFHETERWEYPKVKLEIEGKNSIIKNFKKITTALNRDEKEFFTYILKEVGTSGEIKGNVARLTGKQKSNTLNKLIENYCEQYVVCETCKKPDTIINKDSRKHVMVCHACGTRHIIRA